MQRLGIVGLGAMGGGMARSVLRAGVPLVVFDVHGPAVDALVEAGASAADSPDDLAGQVDVVSVVVVDDDQVRDVVVPGHDVVWAVHSTVLPTTVAQLADSEPVIDAPISGGAHGAEAGDHVAFLQIQTSDEDVPGEGIAAVNAFVVVTVTDGAPRPGDVNGDSLTNFADLLLVLSAWGPCDDCAEDVNGDDEVGFDDLLIVLSEWGPCGE